MMICCAPRAAGILRRPVLAALDDVVCCLPPTARCSAVSMSARSSRLGRRVSTKWVFVVTTLKCECAGAGRRTIRRNPPATLPEFGFHTK